MYQALSFKQSINSLSTSFVQIPLTPSQPEWLIVKQTPDITSYHP